MLVKDTKDLVGFFIMNMVFSVIGNDCIGTTPISAIKYLPQHGDEAVELLRKTFTAASSTYGCKDITVRIEKNQLQVFIDGVSQTSDIYNIFGREQLFKALNNINVLPDATETEQRLASLYNAISLVINDNNEEVKVTLASAERRVG